MLRERTKLLVGPILEEVKEAFENGKLELSNDFFENQQKFRRFYASTPWFQGVVTGAIWALSVAVIDSATGFLAAGKTLYAWPTWVAARKGSKLAGLLTGALCLGLFYRSLVLDSTTSTRFHDELFLFGFALFFSIILADKTGRKLESIEKQILQDPLTGALNRSGLNLFYQKLEKESLEENRPLLVAVVDLDNFKQLNDTYGHLLGDSTLVTLVKVLKQAVGDDGLVARMGGDEFLVVFSNSHPGMARRALDEARLKFKRISRQIGASSSFSYGLSTTTCQGDKYLNRLIEEADGAMYKAKAARSGQALAG
ncbi:MAG: GGDEF domain-containing protein [Fimbriimonadaceae bacterium]|nr:GGDEF domain-containing protein [Fimbriimonadaceae bacterium]